MKLQINTLVKIFLLVVLIYLSVVYYIYYENKVLYANAKYTTAIALRNTYGTGNSGIEYRYLVNDSIYLAWDSTSKKALEGTNYFIVYDEKNPKHSSFFVECPAPDSIKFIPKDGLKEIPIKKYQKYVESYFDDLLNGWLTQFFP
ncbi:hypothetical protein B0I03_102236 [Flavobacterium aquaticum]|uniref:DUF3592 domain-containing protein n=1 Tax=Flavobacterium aquaticum TaxID=1236486 RepID=A0A327Z2B1_9FLAO|nr:hypothetical protein [Flavobacterium aquaticum]RAK24379.1 hypothetical protein B0I03_102236 [Flavobacterium aquaticum]